MAQTTFAGKRCFITGAASGIGRATALRLASQGAELYLTDRNADGLAQTVADARALGAQVPEHRALDIANYDDVASFADEIHAKHPSMDVVMNIAGVSAWGTVDRLTHEQWTKMISINLMGPIHVIENFVPPMVAARRGGHLVNVSSAAGLIGLPWHAAYSASKFGLRGLSEVLRFDLARYRIGVSVVVPGAVQDPAGEHRRDRRRRPRRPTGESLGGSLQRPRGVPGKSRGEDPGRSRQKSVPDLHLGGHPRAVRVQTGRVVALQRGDAPGQRGVRPGAPAGTRTALIYCGI